MCVALLVSSCAETSSNSRSRSSVEGDSMTTATKQGGSDSPQTQNRGELIEELLLRESELNIQKDELVKLEAINDALCGKINKINKECLPKKPITSEGKVRLLSCDGSPVEQNSKSKIEVDIFLAGSGDFKLSFHSANTVYESDVLSSGTQELKFSKLVDVSVLTPSFGDIQKMRLMVEALDADSGSQATITVDVLVDGQTIVRDIIPGAKAGESYELSVKEIYTQLISSNCHLSNEALDSFLAPYNNDSAGGSFDNKGSSSSAGKRKYGNESIANIEQRISWVKDALAELLEDLRPVRDRTFNLRNAIKGDTGAGCHLKQKITELKITIDGSPINDPVGNGLEDKIDGAGNEKELEIDLGALRFSSTTVLGSILIPDDDLTSYNIASLTKFSIRKGGNSYINSLVKCDGSVFGGLQKDNDCYDIKEEFAMDINKVKLEVNGIVVFEEDLRLKLYRQRMTYSYDNIQFHPKWGEMLLRTDCDAIE